MAYKIVHESDVVHVIRPKHWWSAVSVRDFVNALKELEGVVSVTKLWGWWDTVYVVVTRAQR